jgi:hypothetical protein
MLLLVILAGFWTEAAMGAPPTDSTQPATEPATESPVFRVTSSTRPAAPPAATSGPKDTVPEATSDPADPVRVELRVNTYSAEAFSKLDAGCTVLVEGTVAAVNFADSKLDIALNFCKIIDYYLPGKAPAKQDGVTMSVPSPKDLYGTFKANLQKYQSGKQWDAWLKQQYRDLIGKKVTWRISVEAKVDKTDVIKSLKADLNEMGTCLTEMKKPLTAIKHTDAYRDAFAFHPATDTQVTVEKTEWEKADIKGMETDIRNLGKLIKSKDGYPRIVNPIDNEMAAKAEETKSLRADLKEKGNQYREAKKKTLIGAMYLWEWRDGAFGRKARNGQASKDPTEQEMADLKSLEDDIVDVCKIYANEPG